MIGDGLGTGVYQIEVGVFGIGNGAETETSVLSMKEHLSALGDKIGGRGGNADTQIHNHAVLELLCRPQGDCFTVQFLFIYHFCTSLTHPSLGLTTIRSTHIPGVTIISGFNSPSSTTSSTSAIVIVDAPANVALRVLEVPR